MTNSPFDSRQAKTHSGICDRVLETIAQKEETSPLEFDELLSEAIDPDALEALFRNRNTNPTIEFSYLGYQVRVNPDGDVDVKNIDS